MFSWHVDATGFESQQVLGIQGTMENTTNTTPVFLGVLGALIDASPTIFPPAYENKLYSMTGRQSLRITNI